MATMKKLDHLSLGEKIAIDEKFYGPDHPKVALRLNNIAPWIERALRILLATYGPQNPTTKIPANNLCIPQTTHRRT